MNCRKICNKVYHLTSNLLPHYLVKTECSIVQIYSTVFNASVMQTYRICLPVMLSSVSYVYADKFKILENVFKKLYALSTHAYVKCTPLRQRRVFNAAMQNF